MGRFQPFHLGHLGIINEMEKDGLEEVIIGIGSAQYGHKISSTLNNPFTANEREEMIKGSLDLKIPCSIIKIDDINSPSNWVSHVEDVVEKNLYKKFDVVYTGKKSKNDINLFKKAGYKLKTVFFSGTSNITGTEIRKLMVSDGNWSAYVPAEVIDYILKINGVKRLRELAAENLFDKPRATVDTIINYKGQGIVLIKRGEEPFKGMWALPGGHLNAGKENMARAAIREAEEETSLKIKMGDLKLLGEYSNPCRDPRGPVITLVYHANVNYGRLKAGDDARDIIVMPLEKAVEMKLAFDHNKMLYDYKKFIEIKNENN